MDNVPLIRASSLSQIMTDPRTKAEKDAGAMSETAKKHCFKLAKEHYFCVDFRLDNKFLQKGIMCEDASIDLLNDVLKADFKKHTGRAYHDGLTGECDIIAIEENHGIDVKTAWSLETFPAFAEEVDAKGYEWQARAYMALYDVEKWSIAYCMVETPDELLKWVSDEEKTLHQGFELYDKNKLVTMFTYDRDFEKEALIFERVKRAREYIKKLIEEINNK